MSLLRNEPRLRRPSPVEADHHQARQKARRIGEGWSSSLSLSATRMPSAAPNVFGDFLRSCGGPSHVATADYGGSSSGGGSGSSSGSSSGCFGMLLGGDSIQTNNKKMGDDDEDPSALIAKAMNHLSLQEREQGYEDLHGVSAAVHETSELIGKTLSTMELCLLTIRHKPAYDLALTLRPDYVQDPRIRLMFLRGGRFDAQQAAQAATRFVKFLDWKLKLFGLEKLCKPQIELTDLDADARSMVDSGFYQILPDRDTRGRVILVVAANYHIRLHRSNQSTGQMGFYTLMSIADDETNQKLGKVVICYGLGEEESDMNSENLNSIMECTDLAHCMPIRCEATHFLTQPNGMQYALNLVAKSYQLVHRARLRVHFGTHLECLYALLSFGLPQRLLPFTTESELKTSNHKKWVQRRIVKEKELALALNHGISFSGIELPNRNDILLGQGKPTQDHPGNQRLMEMCRFYYDEYNQANHLGGRTLVARKIVQEILLGRIADGIGGGCFLKCRPDQWNSGWWEVVTDEEVLIEKVCQGMRGVRKRGTK